VTHFHVQMVTARKPHPCDLCSRTISQGERYQRSAGMDGSSAWTWKECAHCEAIIDVIERDVDGSYGPDSVREWCPRTIPQLRAKVLWLRRWTRPDGSLYPVPEKVMYEDKDGFGWQVDVRFGGAS